MCWLLGDGEEGAVMLSIAEGYDQCYQGAMGFSLTEGDVCQMVEVQIGTVKKSFRSVV